MSGSKKMKSKFDGFCTKCLKNFPEGELINYYFDSKTTEHVRCPTDPGEAGSVAVPKESKPRERKFSLDTPSLPKKDDPSPFRQSQYETFRYQVLPEWAAIMAKHRIDITLLDAEGKKEVLKMFREYWDSNPPF